jgi:hypothetical protein
MNVLGFVLGLFCSLVLGSVRLKQLVLRLRVKLLVFFWPTTNSPYLESSLILAELVS